ncbi:hypothetical protein EFZ10_05435 [Tatumella sp. TA1]|nr:hypothetical protein EFZ10_05435 [Tatumella sp. TA1]
MIIRHPFSTFTLSGILVVKTKRDYLKQELTQAEAQELAEINKVDLLVISTKIFLKAISFIWMERTKII